ncbi:MAG: aldolase/citrate lyase family protein [Porticoccaceae bacterium]|nr:aldolase/citrate lyase family protein [Porticoccaceae bacterium]
MALSNPHNNFRRRLLAGDCLIGTFVKTPSMMVAEVLASTDLDVVCIDAEHAPFDRAAIDGCLLAYRAAEMPALVRVPSAAPEQILNALDCGATGVLVPHVDSAKKASACVAASRYGSRGRGYAGSTRAAGYGGGSIDDNIALNHAETAVIVQIEDLAALEQIEAIASEDGIDCLFIGMMDLSVALGASSAADPRVVNAAEKVCAAAIAQNKCLGIFVPNIASIEYWRKRGVTLFLMSSDHAFIKQGVAQLTADARANF